MTENNKPDPQAGAADESVSRHVTDTPASIPSDTSLVATSPAEPQFAVGDRICICKQPPYFKTADPMPMLRPPDTIPVGTEGRIMGSKPGGYWIVHFPKGSFLIDSQYIQAMP
ncbi:MAG: DUF3148 domain-containing protein [Cyanothece sp. SIO2G6]|nr:DUF3148 domain-containing protein [Cyanothece sp. SIO2G6]